VSSHTNRNHKYNKHHPPSSSNETKQGNIMVATRRSQRDKSQKYAIGDRVEVSLTLIGNTIPKPHRCCQCIYRKEWIIAAGREVSVSLLINTLDVQVILSHFFATCSHNFYTCSPYFKSLDRSGRGCGSRRWHPYQQGHKRRERI
jgi:hypothetical protein